MWALYATAGAVAVILGIALPLAYHARKVAQALGKARGEIDALKAQLVEAGREIEAFRIALARALDPPPTLDDLERVSALQAGSSARRIPPGSIELP